MIQLTLRHQPCLQRKRHILILTPEKTSLVSSIAQIFKSMYNISVLKSSNCFPHILIKYFHTFILLYFFNLSFKKSIPKVRKHRFYSQEWCTIAKKNLDLSRMFCPIKYICATRQTLKILFNIVISK